jgi:hypothetical protein
VERGQRGRGVVVVVLGRGHPCLAKVGLSPAVAGSPVALSLLPTTVS